MNVGRKVDVAGCAFTVGAVLFAFGLDGSAKAINNKMSYQGSLKTSGGRVTDNCDFEYTIWDAESGGSQVAGPIGIGGVPVDDGIFTSKLTLDDGVFDGSERWLQISVCCPAGSCTLEPLAPRQEITQSPHAFSAIRAVEGAGPEGTVEIDTATGNVGIGIADPSEKLEVDGNVKVSGRIASGNTIVVDGVNRVIISDLDLDVAVGDDFRALRLERGSLVSPNVIGGHPDNSVTASAVGGAIGGGGQAGFVNKVTRSFATVGGGSDNTAGGFLSTVGGGHSNNATGEHSTVGGGSDNTASGNFATVSGGQSGTASGFRSTVVGGVSNKAIGIASTVAGGGGNQAGGDYSFAAGRRAKVRDADAASPFYSGDSDGDEGTFVWADSTGNDFVSTGPDQFLIRAAGGVGINTNDPEAQLHVLGPSPSGPFDAQLHLAGEEESGASGTGAGLVFAGHDGTIGRTWGWIRGLKETDTVDSTRSYLSFGSRPAGSGSPVERMRIDSSGDVGIGISDPVSKLHVAGTGRFDFTSPEVLEITTPQGAPGFIATASNGNRRDIRFGDTGIAILASTSSSAPASTDGIKIDEGGAVGIGTTSPSNRLHVVDSSDDAAIWAQYSGQGFAGVFQNTNTSGVSSALDVTHRNSSADVIIARSGSPSNPVFRARADGSHFNRVANDGVIIHLQQAGSTEGSISVSGSTVSYNNFTGSHFGWTEAPIERGELVVMSGENRRYHGNAESERIYGVAVSEQPNDPRALGAYLSLLEPTRAPSADNPHQIMAVGNGDMWVVDSGIDVQPGDYLISSDVAGHAMLDDPERFPVGYVVARAGERVDWSSVTETIDGRKHKKISVFFESFERGSAVAAGKLVEKQQDEMEELRARVEALERSASGGTAMRAGVPIVLVGLIGLAALRRRSARATA